MAMNVPSSPTAERYDRALRGAHHSRLPPDYPVPQSTSAWPAENVALLERYHEWLSSSGTSENVLFQVYIPIAGHALGLNLKPHPELDIDADLERALDYVEAKQTSDQWVKMCRNGLDRFRRFLRQERGQVEVALRPLNRERYCTELSDWVVEQLERYQHLKQANWRQSRLNEQITRFWSGHSRLWRWLCARRPIASPMDVKRQDLLDYMDHGLTAGYATSTINQDVRYFRAFLLFLQEQEYDIPQALLRLPDLKEPDRLPRFLTDEQVAKLRDDFEQRVVEAPSDYKRRDALLDRAAFYLLWQGGLRLGEVEDLLLDDLDLAGRKLTVRQGKGRKDRTVYLADTAVRALQDYLAVRGMGPTDHAFFYRNLPVRKDLIRERIKAAGKRVGVKVTPHCLRHTFGTQLINAGCRVTTIQKLMGHRRLNATMIYARVHDRTVAEDYYAAMAQIEKGLDLAIGTDATDNTGDPIDAGERAQLLELASELTAPQLSLDVRLGLVAQMCRVLRCEIPEQTDNSSGGNGKGTVVWTDLAAQTALPIAAQS
jgi:site-specific recombinase XerD